MSAGEDQGMAIGDRYRHNHDGQIFEVFALRDYGHAVEVGLRPDRETGREVFDLWGLFTDSLIEPTWTKVED